MDIMELGAIGELVGGVAVIGSLIFVGIQLRTTTKTLRAQSSYEAISKINERTDRLISDSKRSSPTREGRLRGRLRERAGRRPSAQCQGRPPGPPSSTQSLR